MYVVFVSLAGNQTAFFEGLLRELHAGGIDGGMICFHGPSHDHLARAGIESWNALRMAEDASGIVDWETYGIQNPRFWTTHEQAAFEFRDSGLLLDKFARYLQIVDRILGEMIQNGAHVIVFQELGGFLANIASLFAARRLGIDNWFVEPSFFKGRVFFTCNTISAPRVAGPSGASPTDEVLTYLDRVTSNKEAVIPVKDRHHYRGAVHKIMDLRNWIRLVQKLRDKYLLGQREVFEHVGGHVARHVRMAINSQLLSRQHRDLDSVDRFVYYPLHVPADVSLTLRSPEWLDQYALIDLLCRCTPHPFKVAVKEHPALVGAVSLGRMRDLLRQHDNLVMLDPRLSNYEVLGRASAVVTVNSKAGAEALLMNRPVLVLGDAFYRDCDFVSRLDGREGFTDALESLLSDPEMLMDQDVRPYFQDVWDASSPGEIYDVSPDNLSCFAKSLMHKICETGGLCQDRCRPQMRDSNKT